MMKIILLIVALIILKMDIMKRYQIIFLDVVMVVKIALIMINVINVFLNLKKIIMFV